jgi:hypothetical protein
MADVWTRQDGPIWIVVLLFIAGVFAIFVWYPVSVGSPPPHEEFFKWFIENFPRGQVFEWYIVSGILLIGLTAANRGKTTYAPVFALYALALALLVATPIPELLAQFGALVCLALGVLLAHGTDGAKTDTSAAGE